MDAVSLLVHLVFKTFFLALPVGVAWLAFRRLSMSETRNAWLYSAVGLFASFAAAGLAPWALGFMGASWVFLLFSLFCPPLWLATVVLCDLRESRYGDADATEIMPETFHTNRAPAPERPLLLSTPVAPKPASPVFRHSRPPPIAEVPRPAPRPIPATPEAQTAAPRVAATERTSPRKAPAIPGVNAPRKVLDVARDMRGDGGRPRKKELATADGPASLPFLRGTA